MPKAGLEARSAGVARPAKSRAKMARHSWPGRPERGTVVRFYLKIKSVEPPLPYPTGGVRLYSSAVTKALPNADRIHGSHPNADAIHSSHPYFLEIRGLNGGDGMLALAAALDCILLWSDIAVEPGPKVVKDFMGCHVYDLRLSDFLFHWGHHSEEALGEAALDAVETYGPRVCELIRSSAFNPLSNAIRLYTSGLILIPSDVALVSFVSALEGLFTTSGENISYRFRLAISCFLESSKERRRNVLEVAKRLYAVRSKAVHGTRLHKNEESAAIMLADSLTPEAEELARTCLRRIFELRLDKFIETSRDEKRDELFTLISLGYSLDEALAELNVQR